jgi:hypothetical protein
MYVEISKCKKKNKDLHDFTGRIKNLDNNEK